MNTVSPKPSLACYCTPFRPPAPILSLLLLRSRFFIHLALLLANCTSVSGAAPGPVVFPSRFFFGWRFFFHPVLTPGGGVRVGELCRTRGVGGVGGVCGVCGVCGVSMWVGLVVGGSWSIPGVRETVVRARLAAAAAAGVVATEHEKMILILMCSNQRERHKTETPDTGSVHTNDSIFSVLFLRGLLVFIVVLLFPSLLIVLLVLVILTP